MKKYKILTVICVLLLLVLMMVSYRQGVVNRNVEETTELIFGGRTHSSGDFENQDIITTGIADLLGECQLGDVATENHGINTVPVAHQMLTASFTETATNTDSYLIKGTMNHSGDVSYGSNARAHGYYLDANISGTDEGDISGKQTYGVYIDIDDTSTINGYVDHSNFGVYADVNWAGTNTLNENLKNIGGYFLSSGNMGTTGYTYHYGIRGSATGTADNNYGLRISASGATNNYGIWVDAGDVILDNDSQKIYFGEEQDVYIDFDGDDLNVVATGSYDFDLVCDDFVINGNTALTTDIVVTDKTMSATCDFTFVDGILTATTCP